MHLSSPHQETQQLAAKFYQHFLALLQQEDVTKQVAVNQLLKQIGLSPRKAKSEINLKQYYQLLGLAAPALDDTGFFLKLGQQFDITDAGVLGYASLSVENLRQSWEVTSGSYALYPHPLTAKRHIENGQVFIRINEPGKALINPVYLQEEWLSSTWQWMCQRLPEIKNQKGLCLKLNYPAPNYKTLYQQIFPGRILFKQPYTELCFPESWYDIPFPTANPATAQLCQQQCRLIMQQLSSQTDLVEEVQRVLLMTPQRIFPSQEAMAAHFQMPPHSFHRQLKKSSTSYRKIVNEIRMELAKDYLSNTNLPLQEISYLLGYEHAENFFRAFKKCFAITATQYRNQR